MDETSLQDANSLLSSILPVGDAPPHIDITVENQSPPYSFWIETVIYVKLPMSSSSSYPFSRHDIADVTVPPTQKKSFRIYMAPPFIYTLQTLNGYRIEIPTILRVYLITPPKNEKYERLFILYNALLVPPPLGKLHVNFSPINPMHVDVTPPLPPAPILPDDLP